MNKSKSNPVKFCGSSPKRAWEWERYALHITVNLGEAFFVRRYVKPQQKPEARVKSELNVFRLLLKPMLNLGSFFLLTVESEERSFLAFFAFYMATVYAGGWSWSFEETLCKNQVW